MTTSDSTSTSRLALCLALVLAGCSNAVVSTDAAVRDDAVAPGIDAFSTTDTGAALVDAFSTTDTGASAITADAIRAALGASCTPVAGSGLYATDDGEADTIPVCQGPGAVIYWRSDFDVDCDGGRTTTCMVDPAYMPETSATGSDGEPIDAETVPFVVIPLPSARFTYSDHAIDVGQLAVVTYQDRWAIGVFADEGPEEIIGEGSYAMAELLGIDSDPRTGGVDSGATFVIFTGTGSRIDHVESHDDAVAAAMPLLNALLGR
jgi:hypothetical protein